jgi:hypothetical protein
MAAGHRGLPYPELDFETLEWTAQERAEMVRWYELAHGYGDTRIAQFVPFNIDYNPAGFKRYRAMVLAMTPVVPRGIFALHIFAIVGYRNGMEYEVIMARQVGWSKKEVIQVLNFSAIMGGSNGMAGVADTLLPILATWDDDRETGEVPFPDNWHVDPDILKSGIAIDSTSDWSEADMEAHKAWHQKNFGEVPRYVEAWQRLAGAPYKVNRTRFEVAAGATLPAQMYPLLLAHASAWLERPGGLRQALKWAKNLGVTQPQIVAVLDVAFFWGGEFKMANVLTDEVLDVLEGWDA